MIICYREFIVLLSLKIKRYIIDGVINEDGNIKNSTNGTWIYAFEDTLIKDKMTFKANHNLFICSLIDKDEA